MQQAFTSFLSAAALVCGLMMAEPSAAFGIYKADLLVNVDYNKGGFGKSEAAAIAQSRHGGKVLSVSESTRNGEKIYKVKLLLDSGRIKIVTVKG